MIRALPLLLLAACGYTATRRDAAPSDTALPRIAVVPFDNDTYRRGLEVRLTRLVADELRARTAHAPGSPAEAEFVLKGRIIRADERVLSEDRADTIRESSFNLTVTVVLEERASERVVGSYSFTESEPFSPRAGRIATADQAAEEAMRDLAEHIVYWLEARS